MGEVRELKQNLTRADEQYTCHLLHREPGYVVLSYRSSREFRVGTSVIPPGTITIAHYRLGVPNLVWRMTTPDGTLIGHLLHLVRDRDIQDAQVSYTDLVLDIWITPDGEAKLLDEDELWQCVAAGKLSKEEAERMLDSAATIIADPRCALEGLWQPDSDLGQSITS